MAEDGVSPITEQRPINAAAVWFFTASGLIDSFEEFAAQQNKGTMPLTSMGEGALVASGQLHESWHMPDTSAQSDLSVDEAGEVTLWLRYNGKALDQSTTQFNYITIAADANGAATVKTYTETERQLPHPAHRRSMGQEGTERHQENIVETHFPAIQGAGPLKEEVKRLLAR